MKQQNPANKRYVIAVRLPFRESIRKDWQSLLREVPGVQIVGSSSVRAHVDATPEAIQEVRKKLGDAVHIEEEAPRHPAD